MSDFTFLKEELPELIRPLCNELVEESSEIIKELHGEPLSKLPLNSVLLWAVCGDFLRITRDFVLDDDELTSEELTSIFPIVKAIATIYAKYGSGYDRFSNINTDDIKPFFDLYLDDQTAFGYAHTETEWAFSKLVQQIKLKYIVSSPLEQYARVLSNFITLTNSYSSSDIDQEKVYKAIGLPRDHSSEETVDEKFYLAFRAGTGRVQIQHSNKMLITYSHTGWYSNANAGVDFQNLLETENSGIAEADNEISHSLFNSTLEFINKNLNAVFSELCNGIVAGCEEFALEQILNGESHGWKETIAELGLPRDASYATEYEWEVAKGENRAVTVVWVGGDVEYLAILGQFPDASSRVIFDTPLPFKQGWLTGYDSEDVVAEYSEEKELQGNITQQLFAAIEAGDNESVQFCIKQGADLDEQSEDHDGRTPLLFSVEIGNAAVVQSIATAAQDLELSHYSDRLSPWLKCKVSGKTDIADILADCGAEVKLKEALSYAINHGDLELAKTLLTEGAPVDGKEDGYCWGDPPIIEAAKSGQLEITQLLIEFGADFHTGDDGATTYVEAFSNGHFELASFFKEAGCIVDVQYSLIYSARTGNLDAIEKALNEGAEINTRRALSYSTYNAIEAAVASNDFPADDNGDSLILRKTILRYLIEKGEDQNCVNEGKPLLHLAIENFYKWDIPDLLVELGATLESVNTANGQSTLFCVADKSNASMLYEYYAAGGDVSGVDNDGRSILHLYLSEASYFDIAYIKTLVGVGVDLSLIDNAGKSVTDILSDKRNELEEDEHESLDEAQEALDQPGLGGILTTKPETGDQYVAKAKLTLEILDKEDISLAILNEGASEGAELSIPLSEHLDTDEWRWEQVVLKTLGSIELVPSTIDAILAKYDQIYDEEIKTGIRKQLELAGAELPLIPSELTSLNESNAKKLVESIEEDGYLDLSSISELTPSVAEILSTGNYRLDLRGITEISLETCTALLNFRGAIGLGLTRVTDTVAAKLSQFTSDLNLDFLQHLDATPGHLDLVKALSRDGEAAFPSLTSISLEAAEYLVNNCSGGIAFNGMPAISLELAEVFKNYSGEFLSLSGMQEVEVDAAERLANVNAPLILDGLQNISTELAKALSSYRGGQLQLGGIPEIEDDIVEHLCEIDGILGLDGLKNISTNTAKLLGEREQAVWLDGMIELAEEVAAALAGSQSQLTLNGIEAVSPSVAEALATHCGELQLNQILSLDDQSAASLATHKGGLQLRNLENISNTGASALATIKGPLALNIDYITPDSSADILRPKCEEE